MMYFVKIKDTNDFLLINFCDSKKIVDLWSTLILKADK